MADMIEKIAMGGLALRGHIDLQITDPLTGRAYYKFEDHNLVLDGLYEYLKMLCIAALCSYDGHYGYRPMTCFGAYRGENYPFGITGGLMMSMSNYAIDGNDRFPPSTNNEYCALRCPIERIVLTDGTETENAQNNKIDGNIVAAADFRTLVTSGGTNGVFSIAKSFENWRKVYRRWDWASANGNGSISKLHLGLLSNAFPLLDREKSLSILAAPHVSYDNYIGTIENMLIFATEFSANAFSIRCVEIDTATGSFTEHDASFDVKNSGFTEAPYRADSTCLANGEDGKVIFLCSCNSSQYFHIYTLDTAAWTMIGFELRTYDKPCFICLDESGELAGYNATKKLQISLTEHTFTTEKISGNVPSFPRGLLEREGDAFHFRRVIKGSAYGYNPQNYFLEFNLAEMKYTTRNTEYFGNCSSIGRYFLKQNGLYYVVSIFPHDTLPYMQIDYAPDWEQYLNIMTERLLPEPVVKDNMPMYVGYTLEFE